MLPKRVSKPPKRLEDFDTGLGGQEAESKSQSQKKKTKLSDTTEKVGKNGDLPDQVIAKKKSVKIDISVDDLKKIEPANMLLYQLQKALKNEFPRANISGSKDDLARRLNVMRNNVKNKPDFAFEYFISDEELFGW